MDGDSLMAFTTQGGGAFKGLPNLGNAGKTGKGGTKAGSPPPPVPSATTAAPAAAPAATGSPLDSTYYQNVAANNLKLGQSIAALNLQQSQGRTAEQTALGNIAYAQPRADLAAEQRANAGGGLYSSVYDQNLGTLNQGYQNQRTAATTNYQNLVDRIAGQISAQQANTGLQNTGEAAASTQRAATAAAANPALGQTAPTTPVARTPPPGAPKGAKWAGPNKPAGYHGIGGGWWAPNK